MQKILLIGTMLLLVLSSYAQTKRMNNAQLGRTYNAENQLVTVQPYLIEAANQLRLFDYENTFFALENAVAHNPNSAEALVVRAKFKKMVGMQTEAERDIRLANMINPLAAPLFGYNGNRGMLKVLSVAPEKAALRLSTDQKLHHYMQALDNQLVLGRLRGDTYDRLTTSIEAIENNQLDRSMGLLDTLIMQSPKLAIAYDLKGVILTKQNKLPEAVQALKKAIELEPGFAIAWYNLAQVEKSLGNYDMAIQYLDRAIELENELTKAYFDRAFIYKQVGETEKALEDYNKVISKQEESYQKAFINRALTKKMLGDYNGALADLNQAIDDFPDDAELRKNRGNLYLLFNLPKKAIGDYTQAIQLNPDYAESYYNRALAHILIYDKISGCADLIKSRELGYSKAEEAITYFCTQY